MTRKLGLLAACLAVALVSGLLTGCEDDGDNGGGGSAVGTWELRYSEGYTKWWVFDASGNVTMYDNAALTARHMGGTYTQSGNQIEGQLVNPGVGDCEILCTIGADGTTMDMDFIEHWHTPYKHVSASGTKL